MAKELPYFKFEPNQWENGNIQMFDREQKGLFIDLCALYWSRLGDVPLKLAIQKLCGGNATAFDSLINSHIFRVIEGMIFIEFLDIQLQEFDDLSNQNKENALRGWEKRRANKGLSDRNATASIPQCENDAIREEKRREEEMKKDKKRENESKLILFDSWWHLYKKKVGKEKAQKKWTSLSMEEINKCLDVVSKYVQSKPDVQFRKDPATYLNGKHWEDEIIIKTIKNGNTGTTTQPINTRQTLSERMDAVKQRATERRNQQINSEGSNIEPFSDFQNVD